jgi:putative chitinase
LSGSPKRQFHIAIISQIGAAHPKVMAQPASLRSPTARPFFVHGFNCLEKIRPAATSRVLFHHLRVREPHFAGYAGPSAPLKTLERLNGNAAAKTFGLVRGELQMLLGNAVGNGAPNQAFDVKIIQLLLNMNLSRIPGATALTVDGVFGAASAGAITAFQSQVLGDTSPDGLVSNESATLVELRNGLPQEMTKEKFHLIMLNARQQKLDLFYQPIQDRMNAAGIDTPQRMAHFLAQTGHESGDLLYTEELASGQAYEGRTDLGNTQPGDGIKFKGRGLIQLTGRANYVAYGQSIGQDLTTDGNWNHVASDPSLAVDVACWFWTKHNLNTLADIDDLQNITRRVNGGLNGLPDRQDRLERAKFGLLSA